MEIDTKKFAESESASSDVEFPIAEIGSRIRSLRQKTGLTLDKLAEGAGFGKSYLSRIENGKKVPPLGTLVRIASVLGVDVTALVSPQELPAAWNGATFVKASEKRPAVLGGSAFGYNYFGITDPGTRHALQAFFFTFPEEIDKFVFFQHDGEELLHVVSGKVEWQIGSKRYVMEAGDTVHFDSSLPHRGRSLAGPAVALVVMYSPKTASTDLA
jgi:transcriptional regulator with XRE-family HTH domain